jgi:hypothetical protein
MVVGAPDTQGGALAVRFSRQGAIDLMQPALIGPVPFICGLREETL